MLSCKWTSEQGPPIQCGVYCFCHPRCVTACDFRRRLVVTALTTQPSTSLWPSFYAMISPLSWFVTVQSLSLLILFHTHLTLHLILSVLTSHVISTCFILYLVLPCFILSLILFSSHLAMIQQKTVKPAYLCPLGARKLAEGKGPLLSTCFLAPDGQR